MSIGESILIWLCVFWLGVITLVALARSGYVVAQGIGSHLYWHRVRREERKAAQVGGRT